MKKLNLIIFSVTIIIIYGAVMYFFIQDITICDERVFLKDGTTINCTSTQSFDSGMTHIKTCKGERMEIPTTNISVIKSIKIK